ALRRKRLGIPYPNTTLLKAATRRYKAAYGNSGGVRRAHAKAWQAAPQAPLAQADRTPSAFRREPRSPIHRRIPLRQSADHAGDGGGEAEGQHAPARLGQA